MNSNNPLDDVMQLIATHTARLQKRQHLITEIQHLIRDLSKEPIEQQTATINTLRAYRDASPPNSPAHTLVNAILENPHLQEAIKRTSITA